MRWWLAVAFALIAGLTAIVAARVFTFRAERAFDERAQDLAVGRSVAAADAVQQAIRRGDLAKSIKPIADRRRIAVFVYDFNGKPLTPTKSNKLDVATIPEATGAVKQALEGERVVMPASNGEGTLVALPLQSVRASVLLVYAPRQEELAEELGIVRRGIVEAALWAVLVGIVAGALVAALIAARLRRIADAAAAIEGGSFDTKLRPRFHDELGDLAETIDRMRERLRTSFSRLQSERDRLGRLLARLHDGVLTVNRDLTVEFANAAAERLLGGVGLPEGSRLPEPWPDLSLTALASSLFEPDAKVSQARISPDDEHTFAVIGIPADPGATAMIVLTDVSEQERRERAEREFVTNAAHELRTPLTAVMSAVEVLQGGAKEHAEERDRFIGHIEREAARLGRLSHALLVLARAQTREEAPNRMPVELRPLLEEIASGLQPVDGVDVEVRCPDRLAVLAERDLVEQVLMNLGANAVKNTQRGRIVIAAHARRGRSVAIEVTDTGVGIAPGDHERVFDRFYRAGGRDSGGFGLGLAIVQQAVQALEGTVEIDSSPRGTTARILLPRADVDAA
jgi:signal transduction histidine kinase